MNAMASMVTAHVVPMDIAVSASAHRSGRSMSDDAPETESGAFAALIALVFQVSSSVDDSIEQADGDDGVDGADGYAVAAGRVDLTGEPAPQPATSTAMRTEVTPQDNRPMLHVATTVAKDRSNHGVIRISDTTVVATTPTAEVPVAGEEPELPSDISTSAAPENSEQGAGDPAPTASEPPLGPSGRAHRPIGATVPDRDGTVAETVVGEPDAADAADAAAADPDAADAAEERSGAGDGRSVEERSSRPAVSTDRSNGTETVPLVARADNATPAADGAADREYPLGTNSSLTPAARPAPGTGPPAPMPTGGAHRLTVDAGDDTLGALTVTAIADRGSVNLFLAAAEDRTRDALMQQRATLREELESAGVSLGSLDITGERNPEDLSRRGDRALEAIPEPGGRASADPSPSDSGAPAGDLGSDSNLDMHL